MTHEMAMRRSPSGYSVRRAGRSRPGGRYNLARHRQSFGFGSIRYIFGILDSPRTDTVRRVPNGPDID